MEQGRLVLEDLHATLEQSTEVVPAGRPDERVVDLAGVSATTRTPRRAAATRASVIRSSRTKYGFVIKIDRRAETNASSTIVYAA